LPFGIFWFVFCKHKCLLAEKTLPNKSFVAIFCGLGSLINQIVPKEPQNVKLHQFGFYFKPKNWRAFWVVMAAISAKAMPLISAILAATKGTKAGSFVLPLCG